MFGALIGAIPGIIGAVMQSNAEHDQNVMNWENLQFQKQNAQQQMDLATSGRTDVYGNKETYDPASKQWITTLTPEQKQITDALQRQQLESMTTDADRARALRAEQFARSQQAATDYGKARLDYLYGGPKSEGAYQDEAVQDALFAQQDQARQAGNQLATLAVRSGQSKDALAGIVNAVANQQGKGIGGALQQGKAAGSQKYAAETDVQNKKLDIMKYLQGVMDDVSGYTPQAYNTPAEVADLQKEQLSAISGALANQANQVGGAYKSLATSMGQSPDLTGLMDVLSKFDPSKLGGSTGNLTAPLVAPYGGGSTTDVTGTGVSDRTTNTGPYPRLRPGDYYGGQDILPMTYNF